MANWRSFGDRMLHSRRSMLKTWSYCSNSAAKFHHSTGGGGGGLFSPVRSSEYFIGVGGRPVGGLKKGATFSSIQRFSSSSSTEATATVVDVVDEQGALSGPLPLRSAPCIMLPGGSGLVAQPDDREMFKLVTMEAKDTRDYYRFFSLTEKKVMKMKTKNVMLPWQRELLPPNEAICFGSSRGWLAFIHPRNCSLYLFNPFSHSYLPYLPLPPIQTLPCFISSSRYNSSSSSSSSSSIVTEFTIWTHFSPISSQELSKAPFFKKIALSSSPSPFPSNHHHLHDNINNSNEMSACSSDDCTVMVIQGYIKYSLAFCRIGDTSWTALDGEARSYKDVIYFSKDQKFYALSTNNNLIEAWDLRNPASPKNTLIISNLPPLVHPTMDKHERQLRRAWSPDHYLVESSGELLMVVRYYDDPVDENDPKYTILFDVYKLDFVNKEWLLLPSLGDTTALFVGLNDSLSVSASDFPGLPMNCIYFSSPDAELLRDSHDLGIFNLEDNNITPIYEYDMKIQLPSIWIVPPQQ